MRAVFVCVALTGLVSCTARVPRISDSPPKVSDRSAEKAYKAVLDRFTAQREIYDLFDTRLFAATTYQSEAFRRAKTQREALFKRLPQDVYQAALAEELAEAREHHEFFLGVHVNERKYDDFDRPDTIWRISLRTPTGEVIPTDVERLGRGDEAMRAYYPYMDTFWTAYRVRFPITNAEGQPTIPEDAETIVFRLSSSLGHDDFTVQAR